MRPTVQKLKVLQLVPFGAGESGAQFFALRLSHPGWENWRPGQFVMLRPESFGLELPWGRPFSICHMTTRHLICFFNVCGRGTEKMAQLRPNDEITAWGPLGTSFPVEEDAPTLLLAGGMGIAPFVGYVNRHPQPWNVHMLFGHRQPACCYPVANINEHITVDSLQEQEDGDLDNFIFALQERIQDCAEQNGLILACGPEPFLKTVQTFSLKLNGRAYLSLENRMACGVGACLGCVCASSKRGQDTMPVRTCVEGPVFAAADISM